MCYSYINFIIYINYNNYCIILYNELNKKIFKKKNILLYYNKYAYNGRN